MLVLAVAALEASACTGALYSTGEVRAGQPCAERHFTTLGALTKAEVLAVLGPPGEVLPLVSGDLFVYRLRARSWRTIDLNTGLVGTPGLSLYADLEGRNTDEALTVRFDREGRVVDVASNGG